MRQSKFVFKGTYVDTFSKGYIPHGHFDVKSKIKDKLLRKGYLVRGFREEEVIRYSVRVAKANVPYEERVKLQEQIDKEDDRDSTKLSKT